MSFVAFKDLGERKALEHERQARLGSSPLNSYVYVNVVFSSANADTEVPLPLTFQNVVNDPTSIRFLCVSQGAAGVIYRDLSGTAKAWTKSRIYLRNSATTTSRILLFVEAS